MPRKNANLQKIEALCQRHAERLHDEVYDVAMEQEPTGRYLRIYIDKDGGVTLDDCEAFHRAIQPELESFDYDFLEVCSPGIDRPLKTERDIQKSIGLMVEARLYKPLNGQKSVQGILRAMDGERVSLLCNEEEITLPRAQTAQVRLVPDLSALDESDE